MAKQINREEPVIVLGAGLAGSLMALYLAKRGFKVEVYERRPDMRAVDISAGKSINLAISVRGLTALEEVGMKEEIAGIIIPMRGRVIHDLAGQTNFQPYSKDETTAINSISRGDLNVRLMNRAEAHPDVNFHFHQRCLGVDMVTGTVRMRHEVTGDISEVRGQTVLACDGAFSGARGSLMKTPRFNYSQQYHSAAYKELSFPPTKDGGWLVEKNALHIWPRGSFMLIALPNLDGSFTVTLFYPATGPDSFESLDTADKVREFFRKEFPDAVPLMPELETEFFENPTGDLVTVKCDPWHFEDKIALLGDAAHAVVPFYGQGMNAAFEDCTVLNACLDLADTWEGVFEAYGAQRVKNGHAIADLAVYNYIEMRDNVGNAGWVFRKKIEHELEKAFPGRYVSRYELVSFTRVPYAIAEQRGLINDEILHELAAGIEAVEQVDMALAERLITEKLDPIGFG